jgi:hypothetical protein
MITTAAAHRSYVCARTLLATAALLFALFVAVQARPAVAAASGIDLSCQGTTERVFARWLDPFQYALAPYGDFERDGGWQLKGGARVVSGNESFFVHAKGDRRSLALPGGASALSSPICLGLADPIVRFFSSGGALLSLLKVEAVYTTALGTVVTPVGVVLPSRTWSPGLPLPLLANVVGLTSLQGTTTSVQLRFTSVGRAEWRIDDVYVDPWKIH